MNSINNNVQRKKVTEKEKEGERIYGKEKVVDSCKINLKMCIEISNRKGQKFEALRTNENKLLILEMRVIRLNRFNGYLVLLLTFYGWGW